MKDEDNDTPADRNSIEIAIAFLVRFPIGTTLHPSQFDRWAWDGGYLPEPRSLKKGSDSWKAHLTRRQELKALIRRAAISPIYMEMGESPFAITFERGETWAVRSTQDAIVSNRLAVKVGSVIETNEKTITGWSKTLDMTQLAPVQRLEIEQKLDAAQNLKEQVELNLTQYQRQVGKLEQAMQKFLTGAPAKALTDGSEYAN